MTRARGFLGHPRGLLVLFATEGFSSFALYGLQSILVLALSNALLQPGPARGVLGLATLGRWLGWDHGAWSADARAAMLAGLFGAAVFMAPMLGGIVADRLLGHTRAVLLGRLGVIAGLVLLAFPPLFLSGLALFVAGSGLASTTLAQLGGLYAADDPRRSNGFQIYSGATTIAVIFAPLVCGTLGETRSWTAGFLAAAMGALLAFAVYAAGCRSIHPPAIAHEADPADHPAPRVALGRRDWLVLAGLALLLPVLALNAIGNMEIYNGYLLWARQHYDLRWGGHTMPVSWLLSVDAVVSIAATAASVGFWTLLERRGRPVADLPKIAIGTLLCLLAVLVLAAAPTGRVGLGWGLAFHVLNDLGSTNTYMVSMSLYSRVAPPALRATVTNACTLQIFLANLIVARLASRLDVLGPRQFWLTHAVLIGASAGMLGGLVLALRMRPRRGAAAAGVPDRSAR